MSKPYTPRFTFDRYKLLRSQGFTMKGVALDMGMTVTQLEMALTRARNERKRLQAKVQNLRRRKEKLRLKEKELRAKFQPERVLKRKRTYPFGFKGLTPTEITSVWEMIKEGVSAAAISNHFPLSEADQARVEEYRLQHALVPSNPCISATSSSDPSS